MTKPKLPCDVVLHGDCTKVLDTLPEKSVDLIFADPPYNLQLQHELIRPNQTKVNGVNDAWDKFDSFADYDEFTKTWLMGCRRVLKDNGSIWVIGSYHNIFRVGTIMMDLGYWILNDVLWHKTNPMPNFRGTRFTNATETLIWAKKSCNQKKYTFNYHAMKHLNEDKQMQNVWHTPLCTGAERLKIDGKKAHSTQKPESLLYRVIMASSNPHDIVLDPFFGTGTTGAVAKKLQRHYIGIEREQKYITLTQNRLNQIPESLISDKLLMTPSKRNLPRVKFGLLLESQYLHVGQALYSKSRQHHATIKSDSYLQVNGFAGSIHKTAANVLGKSNHNGWDFWYYEDDSGKLISIDMLRDKYRKERKKKESELV